MRTANIRNVCLLGHGGSGKTSLAESLLYITKGTDRIGKTTDGNTICDFDPEEIKRVFSISTAIAPLTWKDIKINIIDTPGYLDFSAEVHQGLRVADSALILIDGKSGVEVGAELAWDYVSAANMPKAFFANKFDDPDAHYERVLDELRTKFGISVCPLIIPKEENGEKGFINLLTMTAYTFDANGKRTESEIESQYMEKANMYRGQLLESIAETSEELMEKYFAEEEITYEEASKALHDGILSGSIAPVICGSAVKLWSVTALLDTIYDTFPSPSAKKTETVLAGDKEEAIEIQENGNPSIFIFKTVADPFVGKMSFFKVMSGTLTKDAVLTNLTKGTTEKFAHIYTIKGKKQTEVDSLCCGDIGMTAKLANANTNDTFSLDPNAKEYKKISYPQPFMTMAVTPNAKGDEDKISSGITKLLEEDLTLKYEVNPEVKQMLLSGLGDIHLDVIVSKLKTRFGTSVTLSPQKIAYREAIKKKVQTEGKHKKQSGGHGQYGHVKIEFSPGEGEGLTFTESIFGGSVPKQYHPAVEKGLLESMQKGVLAGFPMINLKANLFDGSYHDVDSSEMAFKIAANLAYKEGLKNANPVILEPIGELKTFIPDSLVGDVMGDINKRRGRVLGINPDEKKKGYTIVEAEVPKSEMTDYTIALRAISQGKGSFTFTYTRYDEVPAQVAQKIIDDAKANADA